MSAERCALVALFSIDQLYFLWLLNFDFCLVWFGFLLLTKTIFALGVRTTDQGHIYRNISEIIMPGGLPPPFFLPPPNSLQTLMRVSMSFLAICLTPGSMFILTPHKDIFSGLLRQESGAGGFWNFPTVVFSQTGGNGIFCQFDLST